MNPADYYDRYWRVGYHFDGKGHPPPDPSPKVMEDHYRFMAPFIGSRVLEMGCGDGKFLKNIQNKLLRVKYTGIDISENAIHRAWRGSHGITFVQGDVGKTGGHCGQFDTILSVAVIEHLLDPDAMVAEAARILTPGGHLILITTDFNILKRFGIALAWNRYFDPRSPHIRHFTRKSLRQLCARHGFVPVKYEWDYSYYGIMPLGQRAVFQKGEERG